MFTGDKRLRIYIAPKDEYTYIQTQRLYKSFDYKLRYGVFFNQEEKNNYENIKRLDDGYHKSIEVADFFNGISKTKPSYDRHTPITGEPVSIFTKLMSSGYKNFYGLSTEKRMEIDPQEDLKNRIKGVKPKNPYMDFYDIFQKQSIYYKMYIEKKDFEEAMLEMSIDESFGSEWIYSIAKQYMEEYEMKFEEALEKTINQLELLYKYERYKKYFVENYKNRDKLYTLTPYRYRKLVRNKVENKIHRQMAYFDIDIFYLKEFMRLVPGLNYYVLDKKNNFHKIMGVVGIVDRPFLVRVIPPHHGFKNKYIEEFGVSNRTRFLRKNKLVSRHILYEKKKMDNLFYKTVEVEVSTSNINENMYDLLLDIPDVMKKQKKTIEWLDSFDQVFGAFDYFNEDDPRIKILA